MKKVISRALDKINAVVQKAAISVAVLASTSQFASAQGLQKAKGVLEGFKVELTDLIPTVAVIALILLGIGYATKFVEKDTFVRWGIGVIIVGSAAQIVALFLT